MKRFLDKYKEIIKISFLILTGFIFGFITRELTIKKFISPDFKEVINDRVPECAFSRCPEYISMDVDGDPYTESLAIIPITMTQGAGYVIVIDEGKIVWKSKNYMRVGVKRLPDEDKYGFIIVYGKEVNSTEGAEIRYIYQNGQFIAENSEE